MNVAFYAPLKPPSHPTPSGDRALGRLLMSALTRAGHHVTLASRFRSREPHGDRARQARLEHLGGHLAGRLCRRFRALPAAARPELWFTYHLYYKAPDFLGPAVASDLGIPYVVAEASYAASRARGPWREWHEISARAIESADAVIAMNSDDVPGLASLLGSRERVQRLPPFIDTARFRAGRMAHTRQWLATRLDLDPGRPWLLAVAMMRPGRKAACFRFLARALRGLTRERWQLVVVGGGEAESEVRASFAPMRDRVRFLGVVPGEALPAVYRACDIFAWPALGEPLGLVFLEAQAAGLPVVAGASRGVPDLVCDRRTGLLAPEGDEAGFRRALGLLLDDSARRHRMGVAARRHVERTHTLPAAARRLEGILGRLRT